MEVSDVELILLGGTGVVGLLVWIIQRRSSKASSPASPLGKLSAFERRNRAGRRNRYAGNRDDDSDGPFVSNDFDSDDSDSDRLLRAADRFENAGDSARAQQARAAAADVDAGVTTAATTLALAEFLDSGSDRDAGSSSGSDSSTTSSSSDNS